MNPDQGFVDLRLNRQEGQTEESFWPSFTDIMTVIVMIFLLVMVILLLRNMEFVNQLRATMQAELDATAKTLDTLQAQHAELLTRHDGTQTALHVLREEHAARMRELADTGKTLGALQQDQAVLQSRYDATRAELETMRQDQAGLQEDYSSLKLKYDDLVRPARSAEGRFVVEVRVAKEQGEMRISYRESRDQVFQPFSRAELDAALSRHKDEHKQGLYIRVIIPEDSGLSYNEAWKFTSDIHRYDYYFQEK